MCVCHTHVVETERSKEETLWLSQIAATSPLICGVVGWVPLTSSAIVSELERVASLPKVKAVRHPIHDESDDQFVLRDDFNRGIAALKQFDLRYDILIFEKHLPQTIQFVDRHPDQVFILDHVAKPRVGLASCDSGVYLRTMDRHSSERDRSTNSHRKRMGPLADGDRSVRA